MDSDISREGGDNGGTELAKSMNDEESESSK